MASEATEGRRLAVKTLGIIVLIALFALAVFMLVDDANNNTVQPTTPEANAPSASENENIPPEPANPNVTGGDSAGGSDNPNDPNIPVPSPAGGTDSNNQMTDN